MKPIWADTADLPTPQTASHSSSPVGVGAGPDARLPLPQASARPTSSEPAATSTPVAGSVPGQSGPRDFDSVIEGRYWLTEKGWAAARALEASS